VQDGGEGALPHLFLEDSRHVVVGLARMDHQRQPGFARRGDVVAEAAFLRLARAVVVVIVEPGLTDRHDLGMARARHQIGRGDVELLVGAVRMGADRTVDVRESLRDCNEIVVLLHLRGDCHHPADAGVAGAPDNSVEVAGEIRKIEMAMAVDQHDL
jgi:hypothetical protein